MIVAAGSAGPGPGPGTAAAAAVLGSDEPTRHTLGTELHLLRVCTPDPSRDICDVVGQLSSLSRTDLQSV
jgi:hypothetical protein